MERSLLSTVTDRAGMVATQRHASRQQVAIGVAAAHRAGVVLGVLTGIALGLSDFGAQWLWLDTPKQRLALAGSCLGFQLASWAVIGALTGPLWAWLSSRIRRTAGGKNAELVAASLLSAPVIAGLAWAMSSGGGLESSGLRIPVAGAIAVVGTAASMAVLGALRWLVHPEASARKLHVTTRVAALVMALVAFLGGKLDQWAFPGHYLAAHLGLTVGCAACVAMSGSLARAAFGLPVCPKSKAGYVLSLICAPVGLAVAIGCALGDQNARVALTHPRASHTRSLALLLGPAVDSVNATMARRALRRTDEVRSAGALHTRRSAPTLPDAHILLITVDALRADHLGIYGYRRNTSPFIDDLAQRGILVDHAVAQTPHSSYSLASLFTSSYAHLAAQQGELPNLPTVADTLSDAGYLTAAFFTSGIFHTGRDKLTGLADRRFGFARYEDDLVDAAAITDATLAELRRARDLSEPNTFTWVHYFNVHEPYRSTHFGTTAEDRYDGEIALADREIKRLVTGARAALARPVIVILTADHGEAFREHGDLFHGSSLYAEQVRVPLVIEGPGIQPRRIDQPVELSDVATTLLPLVGISAPDTMLGRDLLHQVARTGALSTLNNQVSLTSRPWKLIYGLRFGQTELYNLETDPQERHNLVDRQPEVAKRMLGQIDRRLDRLARSQDTQAACQHVLARAAAGDSRLVPELLKLARDGKRPTSDRISAVQYLGQLGPGGSLDPTTLADRLDSLAQRRNALGTHAAVALGHLGDRRARPWLRRLIDPFSLPHLRCLMAFTPCPARLDIALALAKLGDRAATEPLLGLLASLRASHRESDERRVIEALGNLRDPRALTALLQRIMDPWVGYAAASALGQLGDARARPHLALAAKEAPTQDIRDNAARALTALPHVGSRLE